MLVEDVYEQVMGAIDVQLPHLEKEEYDELGDEIFLRLQKLRSKE